MFLLLKQKKDPVIKLQIKNRVTKSRVRFGKEGNQINGGERRIG